MKLILTGLPGCGKGTQSDILGKKLGVNVIHCGEVLRTLSQQNLDISPVVRGLLHNSTEPLEQKSIDVICPLLVGEKDENTLLDGYGRLPFQFEYLLKNNIDFALINIVISEALSLERVLGRVENRDDDNIETHKRRIEHYQGTLSPLLKNIGNTHNVYEVEGNSPIDVVTDNICKIIFSENIFP